MSEVPATAPTSYHGIPVPESLQPNWDQPEALWWRKGVDGGLGHPGAYARYQEGLLAQKDVASAYAVIERTGYELERADGTGGSYREYQAGVIQKKADQEESAGRLTWLRKTEALLAHCGAEDDPRYLYQNLTVLAAWVVHWAVTVDQRRKRGKR